MLGEFIAKTWARFGYEWKLEIRRDCGDAFILVPARLPLIKNSCSLFPWLRNLITNFEENRWGVFRLWEELGCELPR